MDYQGVSKATKEQAVNRDTQRLLVVWAIRTGSYILPRVRLKIE